MVKTQGPQGWIGVDLDGTLAFYEHWTKWNEFGEPIPMMVDRVKGWLADGTDVRIVTARVPLPQNDEVEDTCYKTGEKFTGVMMRHAIAMWCEKHVGQRLRSQCYKDLHMIESVGRSRGRRGGQHRRDTGGRGVRRGQCAERKGVRQ